MESLDARGQSSAVLTPAFVASLGTEVSGQRGLYGGYGY